MGTDCHLVIISHPPLYTVLSGIFLRITMEKVRVRHLVKSGRRHLMSDLELTYEVDPFNRELLSCMLEDELESSLNELEMSLKKNSKIL